MSDIWICCHSCVDWTNHTMWETYFEKAEETLGFSVTHLDDNDPVRKKAKSAKEMAVYISDFSPQKSQRYIFGICKTTKVSFTILINRDPTAWANYIRWIFPKSYVIEPDYRSKIESFFMLCNKVLGSFFGYCDTVDVFKTIKARHGTVDLESELPGVFWLTYFGDKYIQHFGKSKLKTLPVSSQDDQGLVVKLGESPRDLEFGFRETIATQINKDAFIGHGRVIGNRKGEFVLTLRQLAK